MIDPICGEIHITHKDNGPYWRWKIIEIAERHGLKLFKKKRFPLWEYRGYYPKKGAGKWPNNWFSPKWAFTYIFVPHDQCIYRLDTYHDYNAVQQ